MARWDPVHAILRVKSHMHTEFQICSSKIFCGQNIIFGFFPLITMVTIFRLFIAHVLSWFKTYWHYKFQRNPPTRFATRTVQIYRQTDIREYHTKKQKKNGGLID